MGRPKGDPVDGVLLLDKPRGMSSGAAVGKARWLLSARKAGHTGTLDPLATGLLPLTFGEATKFSADLLDADKAYEARLRFGETTSTGDLEGEVTSRAPVTFGRAQLEAMLPRFTGAILQMPPMHSALKRDGRPLYALAREGRVVERAPRRVRIDRLELLAFDGAEAVLAIACSKGTYVRVLAEDIGRELGCGGCLAGLRRTAVGGFSATNDLVTLERLEALAPDKRMTLLLPVDALLTTLPRLDLDAGEAQRLQVGQTVDHPDAQTPGLARTYGPGREFLGVAEVVEPGRIVPRRLRSQPLAAAGAAAGIA
jgi:tRNA pseudouridine55 synthase